MENLKLFMLMLGCKPPGRHVEQHDVFFGIAPSLRDLVPEIQAFWPEPEKIHIDAWREVSTVDGYAVKIAQRGNNIPQDNKLFFINLGGYQPDKFEEQHYVVLTVQNDFASASKNAKETFFFKHNHFAGANSHIDDKYGVDVDDIYNVEDILNPAQTEKYQIELIPNADLPEDKITLGYFKLSNL
ncbi:DUF1543 domain-containing protein [Mucilaginibacter sp. SMC90]|uniref:DUF1543 domain-containing protein n=1 Tax=Mucilaginibacter sp. SMC90 TaxID=2929803 RepID=UPI001FB1A50A|nr:DUF1543 domain-containing protein [Mucilaginibacter sp. SMC90]UOE46719.1 DUF1543 domain-containing protein [Mucilaginibacter sp. SMC90]